MTTTMRTIRNGIPFALALALATACAGKSPANVTENKVNVPDLAADRTALGQQADAMGLATPDSYVQKTQFEVLDAQGKPVANAKVTVAGQILQTDERGLITIPEGVTAASTTRATIEAAGFVPHTIQLLPGAAVKLNPQDQKVTRLGASGGVASNSDSTMQVVIPPGALPADTDLKVTRTYSATGDFSQPLPEQLVMDFGLKTDGSDKRPMTVATKDVPLLGQYGYSLDLGGQELAPGSHIQVRWKTEGKFKELLAAHLDNGDTMEHTTESVSRDANGDIWVAMEVFGPAAAGSAPAAPAAAAPGKLSLLSIPACQQWVDAIPHDVWIPEHIGGSANDGNHTNDQNAENDWMSADTANARATTICTTRGDLPMSSSGWITLQTHDGNYNSGHCNYFQFDPAKYECINNKIYTKGHYDTTYTYDTSRYISAHVSWSSDDDRIAGQAVPGAVVNFNHSQSSARSSATSVTTDGGGDATAIGLAQTGGNANCYLPGQPSPWAIGGSNGYTINCNTVQLSLTKNKPVVTLATTTNGTATVASLNWPTNLGNLNGPAANPTWHPAIDLNSASASFNANGSLQPTSDSWLDVQGASGTIAWNGTTTLQTQVWWSKQIAANLTWASNDATVPADEQPATKWSGAAAGDSTLSFGHAISGATNKPAARNGDPLSFSGVSSATTWGLNGAVGTASASHTTNGVTLTGAVGYTVAGQTVNLGLNANLPELVFTINGAFNNKPWNMTYTLVRSDGAGANDTHTMVLPAPGSDGKIHLFLPVEEPVGTAYKWTFKPTFITNGDYSLTTDANDFNFPPLGNLARATVTPYNAFKTNLTIAK